MPRRRKLRQVEEGVASFELRLAIGGLWPLVQSLHLLFGDIRTPSEGPNELRDGRFRHLAWKPQIPLDCSGARLLAQGSRRRALRMQALTTYLPTPSMRVPERWRPCRPSGSPRLSLARTRPRLLWSPAPQPSTWRTTAARTTFRRFLSI